MTTVDFILTLFWQIDDEMKDISKHPQSHLYPSEIVTLAILFATKGVGNRALYRWLQRDYLDCFPFLPERTRLFRLFKTHQSWSEHFLAQPTILGIADSYGIELIHPMREGRSPQQIGKKGISNHRWIVGGKLAFIINQSGLVTAWTCDTANVHDSTFHPLIELFNEQMIVFADQGFHAKTGDPPNLKICKRGTWNERMIVETVLSMLTTVCHFKKISHRVWDYFRARLGFTMAAFNLLVQLHGLEPDENGRIHLSIAEFGL